TALCCLVEKMNVFDVDLKRLSHAERATACCSDMLFHLLPIKTQICLYLSHCVSSHQGAPEGLLERCNYIRVSNSGRVPLSPSVREQLLSTIREWGSGRDTLRCLAMATRDKPPAIQSLNLENPATFVNYEVLIIV
ncbi:hypothetical protein GOODEAATRI_029429, partial [Goodea atripinnis]